jgi:hypothetical protein
MIEWPEKVLTEDASLVEFFKEVLERRDLIDQI